MTAVLGGGLGLLAGIVSSRKLMQRIGVCTRFAPALDTDGDYLS